MYAIYSNVEDPDGFYGVKTHDVESALHRRLEHEGDYWRSIGVHGAIVESTLSSISAAPSMTSAARDFHELGFNHIANAVLRNAGSGTSADPFVLDLAWRTADWDLPLNADAASTSQGLLYSALRTVHRERDQDAARLVALNAVRAEVGRLQGLGMERMAEIKQTTANLLCLREIVHWLSPEVQIAVNEGDFAGDTLRSFAELRPSLE